MNALCQMTGLSRAGFYRWRVPCQVTPVEMELRDQLQKIALESPAYGYRRITRELQRRGFQVNHKHVLRMMREDNLLCVRRRAFIVTTDSRHNLPVYPNLARQMTSLRSTSCGYGKTDKVDLRCDGTIALVLKAGVAPNSSGVFSTTISAVNMAKVAGQSCVLRAVPAGGKPSAAFVGPRLLIGDVRLITVKGGPSNGAVVDYRVRAPQLTGRGIYSSIGSCGVQGSATFSATYTVSTDVFACAARLANTIGAQSAIQVDGSTRSPPRERPRSSPAAPTSRASVPLAVAVSTDPATGNLTIRESEVIVKCAPDQTTWPATPATCTSFTPSGVRLDRTITQGRDGRLASVIDTWTSTDGHAHKLSTTYENGSISGAAFWFPWLTKNWVLYDTGNLVTPSATSPFSYLVKYASASDNDTKHSQGSALVQLAPEAMAFRSSSSLWVKEVRTVPATGNLTIGLRTSGAPRPPR